MLPRWQFIASDSFLLHCSHLCVLHWAPAPLSAVGACRERGGRDRLTPEIVWMAKTASQGPNGAETFSKGCGCAQEDGSTAGHGAGAESFVGTWDGLQVREMLRR